jgi:hypothetical protein
MSPLLEPVAGRAVAAVDGRDVEEDETWMGLAQATPPSRTATATARRLLRPLRMVRNL